jgi:hypothetical protein
MMWTEEERTRVEQTFLGLCEFKKQKLSKVQVMIWFRIFEKYDANSVVQALEMAIETLKWFPTPPEIVEFIQGSKADRAAASWIRFCEVIQSVSALDSVIFEDTRLSAMVDYFGGWAECHKWKEDELTFRRMEFIKVYSALRDAPPGKKHIGELEHQNSVRGYLEFIPDPVIIPQSGAYRFQLSLPPPEDKLTDQEQKLLEDFQTKGIEPTFQMVQDKLQQIGRTE